MKKLLVIGIMLGVGISAGTLLGILGGKEGGAGNIRTDVETGDIDIAIDAEVNVLTDLVKINHNEINNLCSASAGATSNCSAVISGPQSNAVGDMYDMDFIASPIDFGTITQQKYIRNPFANSNLAYVTFLREGVLYEVALLLLSYNVSDYMAAEFSALPVVIQNDINNSSNEVNSGLKMLLRSKNQSDKTSELWLEVMHMEFEEDINFIVNNNVVSAFGVTENEVPFVNLTGIRNEGQVYPNMTLKVKGEDVDQVAPRRAMQVPVRGRR